MRRLLSACSALAVLAAAPARAAAPTDPPPGPPVEEVVVVADRAPTPLDRVGQSVTVIDAASLRADQETAVSDLLARTPGVAVARSGGPGQVTSLFIRGAESDQTVVRIDGVTINDPASPAGGYDFGNLLTGDIARIEVLRGPQSTLYGSQAIGGVVDITTAGPARGLHGDGRIEGGSYGTFYTQGGLGGAGDRYAWRLGGLYGTTDGVSAFDRRLGGRETDGASQGALSGRLRYDLAPGLQLDERAYYSHGRTDFDGYPPPDYVLADDREFGRTTQIVDYTGLDLSSLDGRLTQRLAVQYTSIDRSNFDPSLAPGALRTSAFAGINRRIEYEGVIDLGPGWRGVFGAQHEAARFSSESQYSPTPSKASAAIDSGYGQISLTPPGDALKGLTLTLGGRWDDHSTFGGHGTAQAAAAWSLNGGATILRASWGGGFKAPTLYQLYSPNGVATLRPETSEGYDAGVEQRLFAGRVTMQATGFARDTRDQIGFVDCPSADPRCLAYDSVYGFYDNIVRTRAVGVEAQASWRPTPTWTLSANYSHTEAQDRSPGSPTFGDALARRPRDTANATADYRWPFELSTSLALRYAGSSFDDAADTTRLKGYVLVDLRASLPLTPDVELYGRVENLFDHAYETAFQYGSLGRAASIGVRAKF